MQASELVDIEVVVVELDLILDLLVLGVDLEDLAISKDGHEEIVILVHRQASHECLLAIDALVLQVDENILVICARRQREMGKST